MLYYFRYYTIPPMDKLIDYMTEDGSCKVPNFTIGRKGYGNVYFDGEIDIAGLNLDELGELYYIWLVLRKTIKIIFFYSSFSSQRSYYISRR